MKRLPLEHPAFDGYLGNTAFHRRSCLKQLAESKTVFETPAHRFVRNAQNSLLILMAIVIFTISAYTAGTWMTWEKAERYWITTIYKGTAKDVKENKEQAIKKLSIAGAGDDTLQGAK